MSAIFLKEIKSYFKSLFGWIFLAVFTFFAGSYFVANNIQYGSPYIRDSVSPMVIVLVFILPLLTMRIIAEEKRQKTDQFLITAPISLVKVILGKFFALCAIMLMATLIVALGAAIMSIYGETPIIENIFALLGFFLFGCECIAIGMFLSSITEHQFLAAIFTYAVYIFTLIIPGFCQYIFGGDKAISKVIGATDIYAPFDGMLAGVLDINDLIYVVSVVAIFLILTYKVFAKSSVQVSAMSKNRFFISSFLPFLIIAAIIGANVGCSYIPTKYMEHDITKNGWYTITAETKEVLKNLDQDITINVISSKEDVDETVKHYVDAYDSQSSHIHVEYKPKNEYPGFVTQYTDDSLYYSSLILTMGDEYRVINYNDMFEYTYDYSSYTQSISAFDIEGQITAAICSLINGENQIRVYTLAGHGEQNIPSYVTETLKKSGYAFIDANLIGKEVPEDCDILIINGPESDFNDDEIAAVLKYIDNGGKVIMISALELYDTDKYDEMLKDWGIVTVDETVVERDYGYIYSQEDPSSILVTPSDTSAYSIKANKFNILYRSRYFDYQAENLPTYVTAYDLFESSSSAYAKKLGEYVTMNYEDGDANGPFSLGIDVRKYNPDNGLTGEVIIIGSGFFLYEDVDNIVSHGNSDYVIDICKKLVDNSLIVTIPSKQLTYEYIRVSSGMVFLYVAICCLLIPLAFIIAGLVIVILRRRK